MAGSYYSYTTSLQTTRLVVEGVASVRGVGGKKTLQKESRTRESCCVQFPKFFSTDIFELMKNSFSSFKLEQKCTTRKQYSQLK